uniref:33 kDa inner dynein arm light chain, axonemal n=1 Tax=Lygus hesperus TaxID=30085 RepID=A0A0A9WXL9_LYGHE
MWMENGELWTQVVSPATTKRNEIRLLYDDVNRRLWMRHARPFGVCRVRYEIMRQLLDELTRQVTVTCAERGLFLVRIRAELNYTIQVYHYMWRDTMEYFDPIVQKSVEIMADYRRKVEGLKEEIKRIQEEMEDVQWKTLLLEQEKAYERQATLEWYRCRIEEEKLQMMRLATLVSVMSTGDFNVNDTADILSLNEDQEDSRKTKRMGSELDVEQALQLSDTLKELIQERKVAEGRTKTKRLLEDEIVWAKGEISKNKAYLTDIIRLKEPLDFDKWLQGLVQGQDEPTEIAMTLGYDKVLQAPSVQEHDVDFIRNMSPDSCSPRSLSKDEFHEVAHDSKTRTMQVQGAGLSTGALFFHRLGPSCFSRHERSSSTATMTTLS